MFGAVFTQLVVEDGMDPVQALKILTYNDLAFTSMVDTGAGMDEMGDMDPEEYEMMMAA